MFFSTQNERSGKRPPSSGETSPAFGKRPPAFRTNTFMNSKTLIQENIKHNLPHPPSAPNRTPYFIYCSPNRLIPKDNLLIPQFSTKIPVSSITYKKRILQKFQTFKESSQMYPCQRGKPFIENQRYISILIGDLQARYIFAVITFRGRNAMTPL